MKPAVIGAVLIMAIVNNEIFSLLILSVLAVVGLAALVKHAPGSRG